MCRFEIVREKSFSVLERCPKEAQDFLVPAMWEFYEGKEQLQRDEAMRSCGIVSQTLMLVAKSMGYDSNPMIGSDPQKVAETIDLPDEHVISMLMVIEKQTKPAMPRGGQFRYLILFLLIDFHHDICQNFNHFKLQLF